MVLKPLEFKSKPVLRVCSSGRSIQELVEISKGAPRGSEFILLLDYNKKLIQRILPAFVNASIRMNDGIARSKSKQIEMLLLVCGSMKIEKALKECGARDARKFILFATNERLASSFAKLSGSKTVEKLHPLLNPEVAGSVAMTELLSE